MAKKPETRFKERCQKDIKELRQAGGRIWVVKIQLVAVRGVPDLLLCVNGDFWAIELKKDEKSQPDELQNYRLKEIKEAGGVALCVCPKEWPEVRARLQRAAMGA